MENCLEHSLCSQSLVHCCNHCNPLFKSSVSKIADAVVYMVLIIFALNSFCRYDICKRNDTNNGRFHISAIANFIGAYSDWWRGCICIFLSSDYHFLNEYKRASYELYRSTAFITGNDIKYCKYNE